VAKLAPAQLAVLRKLADGWYGTIGFYGARLHRNEGSRRGVWESTRIDVLAALSGAGLARWHRREFGGERLWITEAGRQFLAGLSPSTPAVAPAAAEGRGK